MKTRYIIIVVLLLPLLILAQDRPLKVISYSSPPFHYKNEKGDIVGICVDIVDTIFREMGIKYELVHLNWSQAWYLVENGQGEAIFTTSRKPQREPFLFYPQTDMWSSDYTFFVLKSNKQLAPNGTYEEVAKTGKPVGIERLASFNSEFWKFFPYQDGSTEFDQDKVSREAYNQALYPVADPVQSFQMLSSGVITFTIMDKTVGYYLIKSNNLSSEITAYDTPVFSKGYPMPFVKKSSYPNLEEVSVEFEKRLQQMKKDGRYQAIFNKWIGAN